MKRGFLIGKRLPRVGASHSAKDTCILKQETSKPKEVHETIKYNGLEYVQKTDAATLGFLDACSPEDFNEILQMLCLLWNVSISFEHHNFRKDRLLTSGSAGDGTATLLKLRHGTPIEDMDRLVIKGQLCPKDICIKGVHSGFLNIYEDVSGHHYGKSFLRNDQFQDEPSDHDAQIIALQASVFGEPMKSVVGPSLNETFSSGVSVDNVPALECKGYWPAEAEGWKNRKRKSGWLTQENINEITQQGFHVVAKPHPQSKNPDFEWRYSFSLAEKHLMLSLSKWKRNCFILAKLIFKMAFDGYKLLCSYHLKTVFLWMLDEYGDEFFREDTIGEMVLLLLEKLILQLSRKLLPSYFIESYNLIDSMTKEHISTSVKILVKARTNPLHYVMELLKIHFNAKWTFSVFETLKTPSKSFKYVDKYETYFSLLRGFAYDVSHKIEAHQTLIEPLTYRPMLDILCKIHRLEAEKIGIQWACPEELQEQFIIGPDEYQHDIPNNLAFIYTALASHLRVKFLQCKPGGAKDELYAKTLKMFEGALSQQSLNHDCMFAEYSAFLLDCGSNDKSKVVLKIAKSKDSEHYKHYIPGLGHFRLKTVYFMVWLELELCLRPFTIRFSNMYVPTHEVENFKSDIESLLHLYEKKLKADRVNLHEPLFCEPMKTKPLKELIEKVYDRSEEVDFIGLDTIERMKGIILENHRENARKLYWFMKEKCSAAFQTFQL